MKNFFCIILLTFFCRVAVAQSGWWTWVSGSDTTESLGVWGTQGIPSTLNEPLATYSVVSWIDKDKNLYVYGGWEIDFGYPSALFKYNVDSNTWTWLQGSMLGSVVPVFGTKGIFSSNNTPGFRAFGTPTWSDSSGNLWLLGGDSYYGVMADLWEYNVTLNEWAWMAGPDTANRQPIYGTKGVADAANRPGSRSETNASWVDSAGNFWFYGGENYPQYAWKEDIWKFDPSINQWAWMSGSTSTATLPHYGTKGVADSLNTPGSRCPYGIGMDHQQHVWLFGGGFYNDTKFFNDLWMYDMATNEWTWVSGTSSLNSNENAGVKCADSSIYYPHARFENRSCAMDSCDNLWCFGGMIDLSPVVAINDLWVYRTATNDWTWVSGSTAGNATGVYGTKGTGDAANIPGARNAAVLWFNKKGNLYLHGGRNIYLHGGFNDVWKYSPAPDCPSNTCAPPPPPLPSFASSDSSLCQNACIDFADASINNPTAWQWNFAGGNPPSSSLQNPTGICYNTPGTYDVTLTAQNDYGSNTIVLQNLINVYAAPAASITAAGNVLTTTAAATYQWYFNGQPISGATSQSDTAFQSGIYSVTVTNAAGCSATDDYQFYATQLSVSDSMLCEKFCINFTDMSINNPTSWQWIFDGGTPASSSQQNPSNICYNTPGSFDVTLITESSFGNDTLVLPDFITVFATPLPPAITTNGYTLTSGFAYSYQWQLNSIDIAGATNQSYTVTQTGFYTVLISDENGCISSSSIYIEITGVDEATDNSGISIFPNPSSGKFQCAISK